MNPNFPPPMEINTMVLAMAKEGESPLPSDSDIKRLLAHAEAGLELLSGSTLMGSLCPMSQPCPTGRDCETSSFLP